MNKENLPLRSVRVGDLLITKRHTYVFTHPPDKPGWARASGYFVDFLSGGWMWIDDAHTHGTLYSVEEELIR